MIEAGLIETEEGAIIAGTGVEDAEDAMKN